MSTEDEDIYVNPSSQRQSIRPSVQELNASAATYDADTLEWPSSAKVSHGVAPPTLGKSKGKGKSVRIAQPTENDIRYYQPQPKARKEMAQRHVEAHDDAHSNDMTLGRFVLPLEGEEEESQSAAGPSRELPAMPSLPMVGGIQERKPAGESQSASAGPSLPTGASRFKAMKQAERQRASDPQPSTSQRRQAPPVIRERVSLVGDVDDNVPRAVRDAEALTANAADDEWLDENGNVMSAFRKARLQRQGQGPPGGTRAVECAAEAKQSPPPPQADESTDPSDLLTSISQENEAKIKSMSAQDVQSDLADLKAVFGQEVLDGLRDRKKAATNASQEDAQDVPSLLQSISRENEQKLSAMRPEDVQSDLRDLEKMFGKDVLEGLRNRKASPAEAVKHAPTSAETPQSSPSASTPKPSTSSTPLTSILFDSTGKLLPVPSSPQHHQHEGHEDHAHAHYGADPTDPNREGYTCDSLLLLCRSTVAGQRVMALNMIGRVCSLYGQHLSYGDAVSQDRLTLEAGEVPQVPVVATHMRKADVHLNTALTSVMLLSDRQRSVRHTALSCLRTALLFGGVDKWAKSGADEGPTSIQKLVDAGLFTGLSNILQDEEELTLSRELAVQVLLQLGRVDAGVLQEVPTFRSGKLLATLVTHCLKTHWPPAQSSSHRLPSPSCATLLHEIIVSSRANAEKLIKTEILDVLLRFLAIGPWTLGSDDDDDDEHKQLIGYELLSASLAIYYSLARYGLYASLVSRAWDLFEPLQQLILQGATDGPQRTPSTSITRVRTTIAWQFYRLLAIWTTCATDPHQTTPEHEVTWSQVEAWIEPSLDLMETLLAKEDVLSNADAVKVLAGVCEHVGAWLQCAAKNGPQQRQQIVERLAALLQRHADVFEGLCGSLQPADTGEQEEHEEDDDETDEHTRFADTSDACYQLLSIADAIGAESLSAQMTSAATQLNLSTRALELLPELQDPQAHLAAASFVYQTSRASKRDLLRLVACLVPGEERLALEIIENLSTRAAEDASTPTDIELRSCLRPFFAECLGIRPNPASEAKRLLKYAPARTTPGDLKRTLSLRRPDPQEDEEEDKDPVTGSALWKSPASRGLPLRPDWPLLALDDLLRSAECAVFNRADNLPADWDPNERQVVQAALVFSNWCCADAGEAPGLTSTHLYLAAQKVFMLESGIQGDLRKWTGAVTGKDLFRDPSIAPHLKDLIIVSAAQLAQQETSAPTLDEIAPTHFGTETTYYSFYTDLIGLYDAISYGDLAFSLSLLPPTAVGYPIDYRRLLWKDYSHLLPTVRVSVDQAPGGIGRYLQSKSAEQDERETAEETEMLHAYTSAVLGGRIGPRHQALLWRVAVHHIALAIWHTEQRLESRAKALARAVFEQGADVLKDSVLRYQCGEKGDLDVLSEEVVEERKKWLKLQCGCDV